MDRELTYQMPFRRIVKLGRSMGRKAYRGVWWGKWLLVALFFAVVLAINIFEAPLVKWLDAAGISDGYFVTLAVSFFLVMAGLFFLRKYQMRQVRDRVDFDQFVRLVQDENGIRFATEGIEYYLKWPGISQLLIEYDGVVLSHGNLFWLIPDTAFSSRDERDAFIRDVYSKLSEKARSMSERHIKRVLQISASG